MGTNILYTFTLLFMMLRLTKEIVNICVLVSCFKLKFKIRN